MRTAILVASLIALPTIATAQCFDSTYGTSLGSGGDVMYPMQSIGFAFPFAGATYTDIHITDKGYAFLSNGGTPANIGYTDFTADPTELVSDAPRICALWSDIQCLQTNNGEVFLKSTASECTVTWKNAQCYGGNSGIFDMQMVLSISGTIKFLYGPGTTNNSDPSQPQWQVGLTGVSPGQNAALPASLDLSTPGATIDDTCFELFQLPNTFDLANNGLLLTPTNPGWVIVPLGAPVNCAAASDFGAGCVAKPDCAAELMSTLAFDLANATLTFARLSNGYLISTGPAGTFVAPTSSAMIVADWNDTEETVTLSTNMPVAGGTTSSLTISSNGRIGLSDQQDDGWNYVPTLATFADLPETTIAADWHDYDPGMPGSGKILFEEIGNVAYVTWNGVFSYGTFAPNTFQYQFDLTTGNCTIVYGSFAITGNDHVVGYSVGGVSPTTIAIDVSSLPAPVFVADSRFGLGLTTANMPFLGNPAFTLTTTNVPPVLPIGFTMFGDTAIPLGVDLTFLGMPTCSAYTNANITSATFTVAGSTGTVSFPIPGSAGLVGVSLSCQSVAASLDTPLGLITSNGTTFTVGN